MTESSVQAASSRVQH